MAFRGVDETAPIGLRGRLVVSVSPEIVKKAQEEAGRYPGDSRPTRFHPASGSLPKLWRVVFIVALLLSTAHTKWRLCGVQSGLNAGIRVANALFRES
jgi:hypothetical protein